MVALQPSCRMGGTAPCSRFMGAVQDVELTGMEVTIRDAQNQG